MLRFMGSSNLVATRCENGVLVLTTGQSYRKALIGFETTNQDALLARIVVDIEDKLANLAIF